MSRVFSVLSAIGMVAILPAMLVVVFVCLVLDGELTERAEAQPG